MRLLVGLKFAEIQFENTPANTTPLYKPIVEKLLTVPEIVVANASVPIFDVFVDRGKWQTGFIPRDVNDETVAKDDKNLMFELIFEENAIVLTLSFAKL